MSFRSFRTFILATALYTVPVLAHADPADEARRQAQMQSSRDSAAAIDRRNADAAFQQGLARSSSTSTNSGSSSSSSSSPSGSSPLPGGRTNDSAYSGGPKAEGYNASTGQITVNVSGGGGVAAARAAVAGLTAPNLAQTAQRLSREAAAGNARSQYQLGRMYASGYGVSENMAEARRLFVAAANQRHVEGSAYAGQFLLRGTGGPEDDARGEQYLEVAAQAGNVDAKAELGTHYVLAANEANGYRQISRGLRYMEESADAGKATAQSILGAYVYLQGHGNIQPDRAKGLKYLRMGAAQGEALSLRTLGYLMVNGHPWTGANFGEGWPFIARAIQLGDPGAMATLGLAKVNGQQGQAVDVAGGMALLRQSAEGGDSNGLVLYGTRLYEGVNVTANRITGLAYVKRGAEAGNAEAYRALALWNYFGSDAIAKDLSESLRWARLAAQSELPEGQHLLGQLYYEGAGVPKDLKEALRWFRRAAAQGYAPAVKDVADPEMVAVARTMSD